MDAGGVKRVLQQFLSTPEPLRRVQLPPVLFISQPPGIRGEREKMKRKTYNNVLKAGKLIQKKGYEKQESLEMAVKLFDQLEIINNGMPVEWLIEKLAVKQ